FRQARVRRRKHADIFSWRGWRLRHRKAFVPLSKQPALTQSPTTEPLSSLVNDVSDRKKQLRPGLNYSHVRFQRSIEQQSVWIVSASIMKDDQIICGQVPAEMPQQPTEKVESILRCLRPLLFQALDEKQQI